MFAIILIIFVIFCAYVYIQSGKKDPVKILSIYSQPGKWYSLKFALFWTLLVIRRLKFYLLGKSLFFNEKDLDKVKPLSPDDRAFDAVFFQGVTQDGWYLCGGTERRHNSKVNGLFYILMPELGLLKSPKLPNTVLNADPVSVLSEREYSAEGICFTPVEPMRKWKVSYEGKMRNEDDPEKLYDVCLEAEWTSDLPWFLFEVDMPACNIAKGIALEKWNKKLFQSLEEAHQTHYEQMGYLKGVLKIDNKEYKLKMDAFRDHSFGHKRDWRLMHRYIFHMFYLEDGTKISVGVVCQPCTTSHLVMGYVSHPNKTMDAIDECDLLIYQHGENGVPPKEIALEFTAKGIYYEVKVKYEKDAVHFVGNNVEAKMHERFLSCEVNGVKGKGISEWHYNNVRQNYK